MNQNFDVNSLLNSAFDGLDVTNQDNTESVAAILDKYGLRWKVTKEKLTLGDGTETDFYGVVRTDTRKVFSTCKEGYTPYQNAELAELLVRISEKTGYKLHSGGGLNGGAKVFVQLETDSVIKGLGENGTSVLGYVTGINSHDGTSKLKWGIANLTVCCENTFALAAKALKNGARHTENMRNKVEESLREIEGVKAQEQTLFAQFIQLAERPVKKEHIAKIVHTVTEVDINLTRYEAKKEYSSYAINRSNELLQSISREMNQKGQTLWGLFSGVTHYTSHKMPFPNRENGRIESKYTGSALATDNKAFAEILTLS